MGYAALASVTSGWTGTIAVTYSGTTTTVTPHTRESVASLIARLVHHTYTESGLSLSVAASSAGVLTLSAASTFTLAATSGTATATGFTATYTGAATYTAAGAYSGAIVPTRGLRLETPTLAQDIGQATSDGSLGYAGPLIARGATLRMWGTFAQTWSVESTTGVHDIWRDGYVMGRVRLDNVRRTRMGRLASIVEMAADCEAVTE